MWKLIDKIKAKFSKKFHKEVNREHFPLNLDFGLSAEQVKQRQEDGLVNKTKKFVTKSYFRIIYENVFNFFNILLFIIIAAMIVARIELKNYVFVGILVLNISIGLYQDIRARVLIDKLKVISSVTVDVLRDGQIKSIKANEVVLSDIIQIKQGSQLVCDGTIVQGFSELNESLLTGESVNIAKTVGSKVFSGSFATAGTALYRVDHIGRENYAEQLQQNASKFKRVKSEILSSLKTIFKVVGFIVVALATAQIIIYRNDLAHAKSDAFTQTVGSIATSLVGMIPIGMYLLTSVTLAVGVIRLIKRNMLTQDMYCIETLARVDTLCLDKTGTITDGNLNVLKVVSTSDTSEKDLAKIIKSLVLATKDDNATARAIRKEFYKLNSFDSYSAIPFNSERKYSAVMLEDGRSIVMGAREFIPHNDPKVDEECRVYERQGMRVLVLALHKHVIQIDEKLEESQIIGYIVLQDHIRDDAPDIQVAVENDVVGILRLEVFFLQFLQGHADHVQIVIRFPEQFLHFDHIACVGKGLVPQTQSAFFVDDPEHGINVAVVQHQKTFRILDRMAVLLKHGDAETMERVDIPGVIVADQIVDALAHFIGCFVREGDAENIGRRDAQFVDQKGEPVGQRTGFARTRPGDDPDKSLRGRHCLKLFVIQLVVVCLFRHFLPFPLDV